MSTGLVLARQGVQAIFVKDGLYHWQVDDLMSSWAWVLTHQLSAPVFAQRRLYFDDQPGLLQRQQGSLVLFVAGLSARFATRRLLGWIDLLMERVRGRRLRGVGRIFAQLFFKL